MPWFRKELPNLKRPDAARKERGNGKDSQWLKCDDCGEILYHKALEKTLWVCPKCDHHFRISHRIYISLILDEGELKELFGDLTAGDPLSFPEYPQKLSKAQAKTGLRDAVITGTGKIGGREVAAAFMDFSFMGGSMGSVVGEKIARLIRLAREQRIPLVIVSASGGARMQEGILSLMQLPKTTMALAELAEAGVPYLSVLTDPTTAGVMASYASLGDVVIAEPGAQLGFAGPRVIEQTIRQPLPPGFQSSEFFIEHGMIDNIVPRKDLKKTLSLLLEYLLPRDTA
jgi:acetyl-CoA carboxylase carboxyl transferase subunit beta